MDKKRFDRDLYFESSQGAKFYKAKDSSEGYYHICDKCIDGRYIMDYMPEIYRHDVNNVLYIGSERLHIDFCPICGLKLD